jgi:hypothetical protein
MVNLAAALREEGAVTTQVLLLNISVGGFKAEVEGEVEEGSEVWLKVPGFEAKRSRVVWRKGNQAGCEFETELHERELELLTAPAPRRIRKGIFRRA